jgi:methylmalonyl-CoA/ethylmalonyl-CoA epimerase
MREPVFNETVQLGIVVRDLEATVRRYENEYGIGPWQFAQIDAGEANDYREYGRPGDVGAYRAARRGRHLHAFPC